MSAEIRAYVEQLRSYLPLDPQTREEVVREIQAHLEDRAQEFVRAGMAPSEATERAALYFGRARVVARMLYETHRKGGWRELALAALPSLLVAALFATHLWQRWMVGLGLATLIVAVTLYGWWQGKPAWLYPWAGLSLTPLLLVAYVAILALMRTGPWWPLWTGVSIGRAGSLAVAVIFFPVAIFILLSTTLQVVRRDWTLASLMLLPLAPFGVWLVAVHGSGGLLNPHMERVAGYDAALAAVMVVIAGTGALCLWVHERSWRLGIIVTASLITLLAVYHIYGDVSLLGFLGWALLLLALLLSPAALDMSVAWGREQPLTWPIFRPRRDDQHWR